MIDKFFSYFLWNIDDSRWRLGAALSFTTLSTLLCGGIIYGFAAIQLVFEREAVYSDYCEDGLNKCEVSD